MNSYLGTCVAACAVGGMASMTTGEAPAPVSSVMVATGDGDGMLRVFSVDLLGAAPELLWEDDVGSAIHGLDISDNDTYLLVGAGASVALYELDGNLVDTVAMGVHPGNFFLPDNHPVAISSDGTILVAATTNPAGVTMCFSDGHTIMCLPTDSLSQARSVDIAAGGSAIIAGGSSVRYYDMLLAPIFTDAFNARIVSISADGQTAIAGQQFGGHARVYTQAGMALELSTLPSIVTVAMSGDGTKVATGNDDPGDSAGSRVNVYDDGGDGWDSSDATPFCVYDATSLGTADVRSIAMAADGGSVAFGGTTDLLRRTQAFDIVGGGCERVMASPFSGFGPYTMDVTVNGSVIAVCHRKRAIVHTGRGSVNDVVLHTLSGGINEQPLFHAVAISSGRGTPPPGGAAATAGRKAAQ